MTPNSILACLSLVLASVSYAALEPNKPGQPPLCVIDMHTHLFNARDLPLRGILASRAHIPPPVARAIEKVLWAWTTPAPSPLSPLSALDDVDTKAGMASDPETGIRFPEPRLVMSNSDRNILKEYVGDDGLSPLTKIEESVSIEGQRKMEDRDVALVAKALSKAGFVSEHSSTEAKTFGLLGDLGGYVDFVRVITRSHGSASKFMRQERYPEVDLFVHHMMDLERAHGSTPDVLFPDQITNMRRLDSRARGALLHFVAFDPFRDQYALGIVKRGYDEGAVGVKFYPPSGYRPVQNSIPDRTTQSGRAARWDSRYKNLTNRQLDGVCREFFEYAVRTQLPVFTHCTSHGFEAEPGYGKNADPRYWEALLSTPEFRELRLCFGHSGGEGYWFRKDGDAAPDEDENYGELVVELCLKYPNVYCEIGYLERILRPAGREKLKARLSSLLGKKSPAGDWVFGDKIMYGTDWFMIEQVPGREKYLDAADALMKEIDGGKWRRKFFAGNAVKYLRLKELAEDSRFSDEQRTRWREIVQQAGFVE